MTPDRTPIPPDIVADVIASLLLKMAVWGVGIAAIVFALVMIVPVIRLIAWGDRI